MNIWKRALSVGIAGAMAAAAPSMAFAASPEFARSAEEWAKLRDDVIEYDELAALVHEYNATVQKNIIDYNEFRKEYGDTNDEVSERYRELASDLLNEIYYPDIDDAGYAGAMANVISSEQSAKDYEKKADDSLEDSYIIYLGNLQAEANLVVSAQTEMMNYFTNQLQLQVNQKTKELLQENYNSTVNRKNQGMATEVDVLNVQENLHSAEQAIITTQSAMETGRKKLQVLLGWSSDANPELRELPAVNVERIASMDPVADKQQALESNYTLLINKRKLDNARSADKKETLQTTVAENERNIGASLTAAYQNVVAARTSYDLAVSQAALEAQNLQTAERKYSIGQVARLQYLTQQNTTEKAQLNVKIAELKLFQAMETYEWAINGLAGA